MKFQLIIENIEKHVPLSRNEQEMVISYLHSTKVDKKEKILTERRRYDYIYFVNSGMLRAYFQPRRKMNRIEGASRGADQDVEIAKKLGLKVFYSIDEIPEAA